MNMKKCMTNIVLVLALLLVLPLTTAQADQSTVNDTLSMKESAVLYAFIPYGDQDYTLTTTERIEEVELFGPESFTVQLDGSFYILDSMVGKVKHYDSNGEYIGSIKLPEGIYPMDLEWAGDQLYVLDSDGEVYSYQQKDSDTQWNLCGSTSVVTTMGLYADGGTVYARSITGEDTILSETGLKSIKSPTRFILHQQQSKSLEYHIVGVE